MSYTALYRKYRPNNFKNVVGQDVIVEVLKNSIISNHISHAYLFTGPRGTGKTSIAKIFAHAVNCENFTDDICFQCNICKSLMENDSDIIEIDAASNNGVDEIRTLRDNVKLLPSFCKYKIYIIDEVHMLSTGAFNALLKTLEEPPEHVIFILATTEPNKIPVTILSRCQRFDFNKIDDVSLKNRLKYICTQENVNIADEIIEYICNLSDGGLRDAINLLDQVISLNKENITIDDIDKISGNVSKDVIFKLFDYVCSADYKLLLDYVQNISLNGRNYSDIVNSMLIFIRDYIINIQVSNYFDKDYSNKLSSYDFSSELSLKITKMLNELSYELKNSNDQKLLFEIYIMNLVNVISDKNDNIDKIEYKQNIKSSSENEKVKSDLNNKNIEENKPKTEKINFNLKKVRINNLFAEASKELLTVLNKNYDKINDYISNKMYNTLVTLLSQCKIVAASNEYILFSFLDDSYVPLFDSSYKQIELFMNEIYGNVYKVVAVTQNEWEKLRQEYILNKKNNIPYVKMDENDVKLDMETNFNDLENSALDIFGESSISVK